MIFCAVVPLSLACGCSSSAPPPAAPTTGQTFTDAMKMMCDIDRLAGLSAEEDPLAIGQKRSEWLAERIDNPDGIEFRTIVSVKGPDDQAKAIRAKAKEVGIAACPLADSIEASSTGGLSP
ncbi:hypothetical protein [Polyangium aurulentum]|uniref:hypothetical protein n=1 Tax=Polyangium aurulentum TaxID=2567896 RepID=UPI00197CC905|nr:hypothetical protein [Polyangium aurulentum]UQA60675.1 hypothetical protein E8A73_009435 [Polyangium aurulentum]